MFPIIFPKVCNVNFSLYFRLTFLFSSAILHHVPAMNSTIAWLKYGEKEMDTKTKSKFSTYSIVMMALFAAILCVSAYISIPLPNGTHITLLNFVITLIALVFPLAESFFIGLIWMLLGLVGVPVFVGGQAGPGYLFGTYGGFSFAFIFIAILIPIFRGKKYNRIRYTIVAMLSAVLVDAVGSLWIMIASGCSIKAAFVAGFLPFIALDLVKAVVAAQIVPAFRKLIYLRREVEDED